MVAVILSKREQEIYPFSIMNLILVESKDTLNIPWRNIHTSHPLKTTLMSINLPLLFFMVTIFEEFLVGNWIGNSLHGHQRSNPGWIVERWWTEGVDSKGCNVSSFIHGFVLTISLDPIKVGFIGVERGNDKLQSKTF